MHTLRSTCAAVAAIALTAGLASAQARIGLGGVRSGQPRTNGFQGGPPRPPTAPIQPAGPGGHRIGFPRSFDAGHFRVDPRFFRGGRHFVEGNGIHADGRFDDNNFRLRFHLGSDLGTRNRWWDDHGDRRHGDWRDDGHDWWRRHHHKRNVIIWPYFYGYNYGSYGIGWPYGSYDPYLMQPGYYQPQYYQPPPEQAPPTEPLTAKELGDLALSMGEPEAAVEAYRKHLDESPEDAAAMRLLGVAMLDARKVRDGVAMVALAYRTDPRLTGKPLPGDVVGDAGDLRTLVNRASIYANTTDSASAWLAMAALAQAEGRTRLAARMVERARDAGLDPDLADKFIAALGAADIPERQ